MKYYSVKYGGTSLDSPRWEITRVIKQCTINTHESLQEKDKMAGCVEEFDESDKERQILSLQVHK